MIIMKPYSSRPEVESITEFPFMASKIYEVTAGPCKMRRLIVIVPVHAVRDLRLNSFL